MGYIFLVNPLRAPPTPTSQIRYAFVQKWYVFSTQLLKKFLAALLVGCEPFQALNIKYNMLL